MRQTSNPFYYLFLLLAIGQICSCYPGNNSSGQSVLVASSEQDGFAEYWYAGEGEINTYELVQSRYGETRMGEAVMVFVTEPFSKTSQVKLDDPNTDDAVSVLKLNHIRRFTTGIYDYSMMQSVFTPIDLEKRSSTLKMTTTLQDWCGHTFLQLNKEEGNRYKVNGFSYFESEGDEVSRLKGDLLEDEIWTQLRINPDLLSEGNYEVIPSNFYARLSHDPLKAKQARIRKEQKGDEHYLILEYLHLDRTLTIAYTPSFPHKILSWTEIQYGQMMSKGTLKGSINSAYWGQHSNQDVYLRDSLGI